MIKLSVQVGRIISPTNIHVARLRDAVLRGLNAVPSVKRHFTELRFRPAPQYRAGAVVRAADASPHDPVGRQLIQPLVDTRDETDVLLDAVLGPWFSVLVWQNDPTAVFDRDSRQLLRSLGAHLVAVRPITQLRWPDQDDPEVTIVGDRTGDLKRWFDAHSWPVVFVRPDRFVAAGSLSQDASLITRNLASALSLTSGAHDGRALPRHEAPAARPRAGSRP